MFCFKVKFEFILDIMSTNNLSNSLTSPSANQQINTATNQSQSGGSEILVITK